MDFKFAASSKHEQVSAQLGLHYGVSCKVVACIDDLLWIFQSFDVYKVGVAVLYTQERGFPGKKKEEEEEGVDWQKQEGQTAWLLGP